jgi:predicted nucleic acid-binding protein
MPSKGWLIFIDTNILLDFYRTNNEANRKLLDRIDPLHDRIITSCQIEMEFKKNRLAVVLDSLANMRPPQGLKDVPAFLHDVQSVAVVKKLEKEVERRVKELRKRSLDMLSKPTLKDHVYKVVQRLFSDTDTGLNLKPEHEHYKGVLEAARDRYTIGLPPRKSNDTSCGDAVNWEWIVRCAQSTGKDVVLVSRDTDYGGTLDGLSFVNDWLQQEFRTRVSLQRKISLVDKLSTALKEYAKQPVTQEEVAAEEIQITAGPDLAALRAANEQLKAWTEEMRSRSALADTSALKGVAAAAANEQLKAWAEQMRTQSALATSALKDFASAAQKYKSSIAWPQSKAADDDDA